MEHCDQLNRFLNKLAEGGRAEETSLPLTVSLQKAFQKLGAFQLPFQEAWVLKVVQAAVAAGAERLQIGQTSEATTFYFIGITEWDSRTVGEAIASLGEERQPGLSHLATALRGLARGTKLAFSLQFPSGPSLVWTGNEFHDTDFEGEPAEEFILSVSHFSREGRLWRMLPSSVRYKIRDVLRQGAYLSPIPVQLVSTPINDPMGDPVYGNSNNCQVLSVLPHGSGALNVELGEWQVHPSREEQIALEGEHWRVPPQTLRCTTLGLVAVSFGRGKSRLNSIRSMASQILWVQDGVVIEREVLAIKSDIGLGVWVDAAGLGTDLGGFALRESAEKKSVRERAVEAVRRSLRDHLDQGPVAVKMTCSYSGDKWMAIGAAGAGLLDPAFAVMGLSMVAFIHAIGRLVLRKTLNQLGVELRRGLPAIAKL